LAQSDSSVEPFCSEVDQLFARGDLHFDLRIGLTERCNERLE